MHHLVFSIRLLFCLVNVVSSGRLYYIYICIIPCLIMVTYFDNNLESLLTIMEQDRKCVITIYKCDIIE